MIFYWEQKEKYDIPLGTEGELKSGEIHKVTLYIFHINYFSCLSFKNTLVDIESYISGRSVFFSDFSINKTDCHDITEILLIVALNTIILTLTV
jgi:hypothetical protein